MVGQADEKRGGVTPPGERPGTETDAAMRRVVESARRMGVEIDEADAVRWIEAMEAESHGGDLVVDVDTGVYGHRVSMLDFGPADLARFRLIGEVVGIPNRGDTVLTALAISGSAAQGKIQSYPGDCDYFERVNIRAPTREDACRILADVMRDKARSAMRGPTHRLWEVKFGSFPFDGERGGSAVRRGSPISWRPEEVAAGWLEVHRADGTPERVTWEEVSVEPGWCKLDWIVADPVRHQLANASNMLDVTWEGPGGDITPLDGMIDPYFQEVYLEAESLPIFDRIVKELSVDSVDEYVAALEHEVHKYLVVTPNYGKVARRLYNIFRLSGRYADAAYLRELFDEPATALYQLAQLISTVDEAATPGGEFGTETLIGQVDQLIMAAIAGLEGPTEAHVVQHLLHLRDTVSGIGQGTDRTEDVRDVASAALEAVNGYFWERLNAVDSIREYLEAVRAGEGSATA